MQHAERISLSDSICDRINYLTHERLAKSSVQQYSYLNHMRPARDVHEDLYLKVTYDSPHADGDVYRLHHI